MPWRETSVDEVRYNFILAVKQEIESFSDVCDAFGISRKTGYKWVERFQLEGKAGLNDRRKSPSNRPRDTAAEVEAAIVTTRLKHPTWGPKKIRKILQQEYPDVCWPSRTTFANILKRKGYTTKPRKHLKMAKTAPLEECAAPNDIWSADFKGNWTLPNGSRCEPFTLLDSYSRFLITCQNVKSTSLANTQPLLIEAFQEFGMPRRFRSDNGPPFASQSVGRLSRLAIWLIKLGITPEWITPGKPQENGKHERMHRTLKQEINQNPQENLLDQETFLNRFQHEYNYVRPHEAIGLETPASVFSSSERKWTGDLRSPSYADEFETRRVDQSGYVYWKGCRFFTSEILYREPVGISRRDEIHEVYFGPVLLGWIDPIKGFQRI